MASTKRKILMISDHPLCSSGVGTQSRYLTHGLISTGKYTFRCLGAAQKHDKYDDIAPDPDLIIKPINGFGDRDMLRGLLINEKPDALLIFNDPRFFIWAWEMEDEIHQICPIVYNHLWDNLPVPRFNKVLYESTDLINCINHDTYTFVSDWFPEKTNYIPHALPEALFHPVDDSIRLSARERLLGTDKKDNFLLLWVNRNARRKQPGDLLSGWKNFITSHERDTGKKPAATLVMHTDPFDIEGPNLVEIVKLLELEDSVRFSNSRCEFSDMNAMYNAADSVINVSSAEGFGLGTLEAMYAGKPIIAHATGGMKRQVRDYRTGELNGIEMQPDVKSLVGTQMCPYIYEDFLSHSTIGNAIRTMYDKTHEERVSIGKRARAYAMREYNMDSLIKSWDASLTKTIDEWKVSKRPAWKQVSL